MEEHEFEEKLDAQVPDVFYGLGEPDHQVSFAARGDAVNDPLWPGISRFDADRFCEPGLDEATECPVDEGLSNGEYPTHGTVGLQILRDGEAVGWPFREETKYSVLG